MIKSILVIPKSITIVHSNFTIVISNKTVSHNENIVNIFPALIDEYVKRKMCVAKYLAQAYWIIFKCHSELGETGPLHSRFLLLDCEDIEEKYPQLQYRNKYYLCFTRNLKIITLSHKRKVFNHYIREINDQSTI